TGHYFYNLKKRFNLFIKPAIHKTNSSLYVYNYSFHNKKYKIIKETRLHKELVYQSFDSAQANYNDYFKEQFITGIPKINPVGDNDSKNQRIVRELFQAEGFYGKVLCRKLFVSTFSTKSTLLVFDLFSDSLIAFNKNGGKIYTKSLKEVKDLTPKYILQDLENASKFYTVTEEKGIYSYYFIDLLSGKPDLVLQLNELNFPKKLKIIEGWLYFIKPLKNGLHKLYRVQLEIN
ncbi:MAG: hypothetical protein ACPGVD_12600, partial [Flavobacteriales bacterium]